MRQEVSEFKRQRIVQTAAKLFHERGYSSTPLDAVANQLGVTKPFIYSYFRSKSEILAAICTSALDKTAVIVDESLAATGSPTERLSKLITRFTEAVLENRVNISLFFREEKHLPQEVADDVLRKQDYFGERLAQLLQEGVDAGEFEIKDVFVTVLAIGGMVTWTYRWYRPDGRLSQPEVAERLADMVVRMVKP